MAYTKKAVEVNKKIAARSRKYLAAKMPQSSVLEMLKSEFPDISTGRLRGRLAKAIRQLRGEEIRKRK